MNAESQAKSLIHYGYTEVDEHGPFKKGRRVHHIGEQYTEARSGTATIERIFVRRSDVEMIVRRDNPDHIGGPHGYWANYHTVVVERD